MNLFKEIACRTIHVLSCRSPRLYGLAASSQYASLLSTTTCTDQNQLSDVTGPEGVKYDRVPDKDYWPNFHTKLDRLTKVNTDEDEIYSIDWRCGNWRHQYQSYYYVSPGNGKKFSNLNLHRVTFLGSIKYGWRPSQNGEYLPDTIMVEGLAGERIEAEDHYEYETSVADLDSAFGCYGPLKSLEIIQPWYRHREPESSSDGETQREFAYAFVQFEATRDAQKVLALFAELNKAYSALKYVIGRRVEVGPAFREYAPVAKWEHVPDLDWYPGDLEKRSCAPGRSILIPVGSTAKHRVSTTQYASDGVKVNGDERSDVNEKLKEKLML